VRGHELEPLPAREWQPFQRAPHQRIGRKRGQSCEHREADHEEQQSTT
jgi:hypothetical protein